MPHTRKQACRAHRPARVHMASCAPPRRRPASSPITTAASDLILILLVGCYAPHPQAGVSCASTGACPYGLVCSAATQTCELTDHDGGIRSDPDLAGGLLCPTPASRRVVRIDRRVSIWPRVLRRDADLRAHRSRRRHPI